VHYDELSQRGFAVAHSFSNYTATWPTTIGMFLGAHHFYRLSTGVDDTKIGRSMLAGLAPNPVLDVIRRNGYAVQYVHGSDYFVKQRGVLDYVFPEEPMHSAIRVFGSRVLDKVAGAHDLVFSTDEEQAATLFARVRIVTASQRPWFTFAHFRLPSHAPRRKTWEALGDFEAVFRERTVYANEHMLTVVGRIRSHDPNAIVVILGDHGALRYRGLGTLDRDPNRAFARAGVDADVMSLDLFGIMIAMYSAGRCDRLLYPTVTPVNVMRVLFACLARDPTLLDDRAEDISLFLGRGGALWLAARDGRPRSAWEPFRPADR
jgi:hypothetical protein